MRISLHDRGRGESEPSVEHQRGDQRVVRLHFVHVHEEHAQTEAESAVDRAEHEVQREDEQLRVMHKAYSHQNGSQDREVLVQTDEHRVEEGEERDARELLGEDVEDQLEQPQDGDDDGENAENQLRHGQ